jgi:hypothetical protein
MWISLIAPSGLKASGRTHFARGYQMPMLLLMHSVPGLFPSSDSFRCRTTASTFHQIDSAAEIRRSLRAAIQVRETPYTRTERTGPWGLCGPTSALGQPVGQFRSGWRATPRIVFRRALRGQRRSVASGTIGPGRCAAPGRPPRPVFVESER